MKEIRYYIAVALFSIVLFFVGYSAFYPMSISIPVEWNWKLDISIPAFIALFAIYLSLVWYPLRYNEPFIKPHKGYDKNFKILSFNPTPMLCLYFCFLAILSATKDVGLGTFGYLLGAYFFYRLCYRRGFSIIQVWYETPEGKTILVLRR